MFTTRILYRSRCSS